MVVPVSTPFVHVRPASCDVDQARLLEPPFVKRPLCATATIVSPKLNESGSSCVLCWLVLFVYGSELIGCGRVLAAETLETISRPTPAATAASHAPTPLEPRSPTISG